MKNVCGVCGAVKTKRVKRDRSQPRQTAYCKPCHRIKMKKYVAKKAAAGICRTCTRKAVKGSQLCSKCHSNVKVWREKNPLKLAAYSWRTRTKLKREVFNAYGGPRCVCCRIATVEFLTIDHIEGGGLAHRRQLRRDGYSLYGWLRQNQYPKGYRVLCMNCNFARGHFGYCPHEERRRARA